LYKPEVVSPATSGLLGEFGWSLNDPVTALEKRQTRLPVPSFTTRSSKSAAG
jgi:hypothetical protein